MPVYSVSVESSPCGLQMAVFSPSPHMAFSHSMHAMERKSSFFLSPYKTTSPVRLGCHPYHPIWGFPGSSAGKESTCNSGDPSSIPRLGRCPGERDKIPIPVFLGFPGGSGNKESTCYAGDLGWEDPLEEGMATHSSILGKFLENQMDRGAWQATIQRVAKSWTRLSN